MSATSLKILALILMTIDHIGLFFSKTPIFFQQIGRLSAPIFLFILVNSLTYTSNRKKFLVRIYILNIIMCTITLIKYYLRNTKIIQFSLTYLNIFGTFFAIIVLIILIEYIKEKKPNWKRFLKLYIVLQICSTILLIVINWNTNDTFTYVLASITANIFFNEGRLYIIIVGVIMYFTKDNKKNLSIGYTSIVWLEFLLVRYIPKVLRRLEWYRMNILHTILDFIFQTVGYDTLPATYTLFDDFSWMSIGALPFMLMYNNKKGKGYKYFFYIYYPLHILLLEIFSLILT